MHDTSNYYTQTQVQESIKLLFWSPMFFLWALSNRQYVHPKSPHQNTLWDSILDFCTLKNKSYSSKWEGFFFLRKQNQERKSKRNKTPLHLKSIILGLNTSIWVFEIKTETEVDCTWFRLLNTDCCPYLSISVTLTEAPEKKLGSASPTQFAACTVKEDPQFSSIS